MIFITVGTHPQQFDRLLREVDRLAGEGFFREEELFAQAGHSAYKPKNFRCVGFLTLDEFRAKMGNASLVITHAGEGNVGLGLKLGKKMIVVPRLRRFGEHTNDHQLELAEAIGREGTAIVINDVAELESALKKAESFRPKKSNGAKRITKIIEKFLKGGKIPKSTSTTTTHPKRATEQKG